MHPVICCVCGVTICFGGVVRDMMCQNDVRIGMDSYAFATGAGATTFVALRQLVLHGWQLPLGFRMSATAATVLYLRWLAWESKGEKVVSGVAWHGMRDGAKRDFGMRDSGGGGCEPRLAGSRRP